MVVYLLTSIFAPISGNIYTLLILRLLQGLTMAFMSVSMRAVFSDLFTGKEFYKMVNYMTLCWAIGPIIAPAIGGYLQHYFGWQASFYFLTIYALVTLVVIVGLLPETLRERKAFYPQKIINDFRIIMSHRDYVGGVMVLGTLWSVVILFSIVGPFLIQNILHYSSVKFGQMALLMGLAWFLGNITNRMIINIDFSRKVRFCLSAMFINAVIMLAISLYQSINLPDLLLQTFIMIYLGGIIFPNYFARNIAWFPNNAAAANSLSGGFMTIIAGVSSGIGSLLKSNSQVPLTMAYVVIMVICICVYVLTAEKKLNLKSTSAALHP
jgi:MFS transporter, DHA1 family, multidrug resistance protein